MQLEFSSKYIVTKSIRFNKLSPISLKLSLELDRIDKCSIERDSKYCIVNDAWKFSGRYNLYYSIPIILLVVCWICITYSRKFADLRIRIKKKLAKTDFGPLSEYFAKHWNQKSV
jgi:hypothetical protein